MSKQRLGQAFVSTGSARDTSSRSAADCIGRVGALAAALGVGAMLFAAPWTAAAQTEGSSGTSESSEAGPAADSESVGDNAGDRESGGSDTSGATDDDDDSESEDLDVELSDELESELNDEADSALDDELNADLGDEPDSELDDLDAELDAAETDDLGEAGGASSSGADDVEVVAEDDITDEVAEDLPSASGSGTAESAAPVAVTDEPVVVTDEPVVVTDEPVVEPETSDSFPSGSAPVDEAHAAIAEPVTARSAYTSASVMSARTSTAEVTEPPAKALQAQPGTFLEVASSMLSAVIAPFVTTPAAPAAPSAQPLMWGVLSWVRRELEDTFANFSISIGGRQLVQNGTAYATSEGFGSFAIAHGENAVASASGLFNVAIVRGDDSTATSEGNFTRVRVRGDDNTAETTGASSSLYVRGVGNEITSSGAGNRATVYGEGNEVVLAGQDGSARARVVGDRNTVTAASEDGRTRVSVVGDDNDATTLATDGSRAEITVRGDGNSAAASADEDSTARASIIGDTSSAVATANLDGYAAARITGDSNVASSDALGQTSIARITGDDSAASATAAEARAETTTFGDGNAAQATDGRAVISGDGSTATADGPGSLARVWGNGSTADSLGERNTAFVWGDDSRAIAGPGIYNNALVFGNNLLADTGPGDGRTVYGQPFDPENQAPVAGTPGAQTVDPETGTVTGTLGFTDPDGDTLTYTASTPANGSVTLNAAAGTYTYTPATRPPFGDPDGADSFTVTASDGQASATTTIDVPVTALPEPGNQAPQAGLSGPWQIDEETGVVTATLGFTDPDGDPLTYEVTEQPDNGVVTVDNDSGTYTYTPETRPEPGQPDGEDSFTVVASDPDGLTATNTIGLPIVALPEPDNQAPVAGTPGQQTVDPETGSVTGSLGFTDPDGDELVYTATDPTNGSVTIDAQTGTFTYTPATRPEAGEPDGADAFTVTATDPDGLSASATIDVPVTALPDPDNRAPVPGALGQQSVDPETGAVTATFSFTDPDGDELTYTASTPATGTVTLDAQTGTYTYTPDPEARPAFGDEDGVDAFTLTASDGQASSTIGVEVPVTALPEPDNQAPVAGTPGEQTVDPETGSVTGSLGFTDPDGDELTYTATDPTNGSVTIDAQAGTFTYTPATRPEAGEPDGADAFTVTATDPDGLSAMTTINVPVVALPEPDNQAPVATGDAATVTENSTANVIDVLANDTDADGDSLTVTAVSTPTHGTAAVSSDGLSVTYTPDADFNGSDTFTYTVTDTAGDTGTATVSITVTAVNDGPPVLVGLNEIPGDPARQPQIGPNGTAYQVVVFGFGTSDQHTSVYAVNSDGSVDLNNPVVDMAPGGPDSRLAFAPERYAYQTTFDYINQVGNVLVIDLENPGSYVRVPVGSDRLFDSELSVSPDGTAYVLPSNTFSPTLTIIDPEDPTATAPVVLTGVTPEGPVVFNQLDGTPYVAVELNDPDMVQLYQIDIASPEDPLTLVAESTGQLANDGVVAGPDGAVYVTIPTVSTDGMSFVTHVVMIDPDNPGTPVQFDLDGTTVLSVVIGPDGTAYQAVEEITSDGVDPSTIAATTRISVLDPANADNPVTVEIPGQLGQQMVVGSNGTIYGLVTVTDFSGFPNTVTTYQLVAIDPENPSAAVTVDLEGEPTDFAVGEDGRASVISQTEAEVGGETVYTTHVRIIDPSSPANPTLVDLAGNAVDIAVNPDGYVFVNTETLEAVGFVTHLSVIDPDNAADPVPATYDIDGPSSFQAGAVVGPDGTVYLSTVGPDINTETTNVAVIGSGSVV
ncbi:MULTISPECIES: Ig-like domain-containing protein [Mycobacteriaceae]|uniref:Tandem-95 repeat protein n=3 Tax=Mycobacteriaceae TaxID=1762 RepID=A0ACC6MIQ9_MYCPF|nr:MULTISPECIES: tandem-95 repeat protein [Mycobacteriaceae]MDZ5086787.1 tandem-95 repeat protein [Mycolicibacterium parafortuitum]GFM24908.1 outer membrane adhesin-like protein [Mycobacterium sp. PO2]